MDTDKLVDAVTKAIMQRLNAEPGPSAAAVVTFGNVPAAVLAPGLATRAGSTPSDVEGSQVIVMTIEAFRAFHGGGAAALPATPLPAAAACCGGPAVNLANKRVINEADIRGSGVPKGGTITVGAKAILTALATDYAKSNSITIVKQ
ncbi:MAG: hypothetical protein LBR58_10860 [Propionibacteriaceae bacterium]|jgi:hypothetical protein|nr:hypothetical protein [Propionibacteriaceae bacterium]